MSNSTIVNNGLLMMQNRIYNTTVTYSVPARFSIGLSTTNAAITDTALGNRIPVENGTLNDNGDNQMTGSNGGDNTTDNTTVYKEGAGGTDAHAQNLLTNVGSATKTWTIANLAALGVVMTATNPFGLWIYIKCVGCVWVVLVAGTALQIRFRTNGDPANQYYYYDRTKAQLAVGWNWVTSGTTTVNALSQGAEGAPSGVLNEFVIEIITTIAADTFAAGDVIYDTLRQWAAADLIKTFEAGYPTFDTTNYETTIRCRIDSTRANGFPISEFGLFNTDATPLLVSHSNFTAFSKSSTDELIFIERHKLTQV